LLAATVAVVVEHGYRGAKVTGICKAASVSSRAFYETFANKDEAVRAAFDAIADRVEELIRQAVEPHSGDWPAQTVAALRTAFDFLAAEPELARFALLESTASSVEVVAHVRATVLSAAPFLRRGREQRKDGEDLPESTEESLVGGLVTIFSRSLLTAPEPDPNLLPDLVEFVLSPYLGPEQAEGRATATAQAS
jgi:AcrR family transcriptional regulator